MSALACELEMQGVWRGLGVLRGKGVACSP